MDRRTNANTKITIFDAAMNQLAQNDDISIYDKFSKVAISLSSGQTYFIKVENMSNDVTGYYNLTVVPPSISGNSDVCNCEAYVIDRLPLGSTVTWSATPSGSVTITPNGNDATVCKILNGSITLTAMISGSCGDITIEKQITLRPTKTVTTGTYNSPTNSNEPLIPTPRFDLTTFNAACIAFETNISVPSGTTIQWLGPTGGDVYWSQSGDNVFCSFTEVGQTIVLSVLATTSCGTTSTGYRFKCTTTTSCGIQPLRVVISPNPAKTNMNVSLVQNNKTSVRQSFQKIRIINKMGSVKQNNQYNAGTKSVSVNISLLPPDVYTIQVFDGNTWYSEQFIKN